MTVRGGRPARVHELVRAQDRMSFLYLERCDVHRGSNALTATTVNGVVHIPAATVGVLMLGPGTTITHQAVALLADSGATAVWVGEKGVRYYAHGTSLARTSRLLEAQAALVSNRRSRLRVARDMYAMRFPGENVSQLTMQQLRGREGARVRSCYRENAVRSGVNWDRRRYDPDNWMGGDPINQALSAGNACLYGVVHAVVTAMNCSPGLGFVHTGHSRAFVYDIADLYKAEVIIPTAFDVVAEGEADVGRRMRRRVRDAVHGADLLQRCTRDITRLLLTVELEDDDSTTDPGVSLWDERGPVVAGGVGYEVPW